VNNKSKKILKEIYLNPIKSNILWINIEKLMKDLGATIREGKGSAGVFIYRKSVFPFHRPHPQKEAKRYQIKLLRKFLTDHGIKL
jgi:hypothetical protein